VSFEQEKGAGTADCYYATLVTLILSPNGLVKVADHNQRYF
jgi:hypothetical protein